MDLQATVIIPTFEDWDGLQSCLDCLARQTADPAVFEVIVANNNAVPDIPPTLRLSPNARVIHAPKPGSYAARNAAIGEALGKVLFFTDSDCLPEPRWIEAGLDLMSTLPPFDLIAGGIELFPAGEHWTAAELYDRVHHLRQEEYAQDGWCATANLVARRVAFDHLGMFNDDRFAGGDKEWTLRATAMGSKLVYSAEVLIRHPARRDLSEMAKKRRRQIGGIHYSEIHGLIPVRPLKSYLSFPSSWKVRKTMSHPNLTEGQRLKVLGVDFLLGLVVLSEVIRLRYLSGKAARS
jgi:glycosyltransferase involved in cell wall biosynthesis